jgi:hypothetical protein
MSNRYLERVEGLLGPKALALGLTSTGAACVAVALVTLQASLMMGGLVVLSAGLTLVVRAPEPKSATQARLLLEVGDVDGAETSTIALLRTRPAGIARGRALLLLGRCAERRGDFAEATEVFTMAANATEGDEELLEEVRERRAFCLAATGHEEDAARALGVDAGAVSPFRVAHARFRPLGLLAEALVRHQRRDAVGVLALVDRHGEELLAELQAHDRALLLVLHRMARQSLGRSAPPLSPVDGRTLTWLAKMIPEAEKQFHHA